MNDNIANLLALQSIDVLLLSLSQKLSKAQAHIVSAKDEIITQKKLLSDFEAELKAKIARRAALKVERESLDEKVIKYKIQHATLKKNDEYQAMQLTIDRTKEEISKVEEVELEVLFEIDEMEALLASKRETCVKNLEDIAQNIAKLEGERDAISDEITTQNANRESQAKELSEAFAKVYERLILSKKKLPLVSQVVDSKCSGCHLKISLSLNYDIQSAAKTPVTCEHCGRILYT